MTTSNFNEGSEICIDGAHFYFHMFGIQRTLCGLGQGSCLGPTENWSDIVGSGRGQIFKREGI